VLNLYVFHTQVSAQDKASGISQKITITSDKGRLSEDEIARMVKEAEEHAEDDKRIRGAVDARNQLESYLYSVKGMVTESLKSKLSEEDRMTITEAVTEALSWVEGNPVGDNDRTLFEAKRAEVEAVVSPLLSKAYQQSASSAPGAPPTNSNGNGDEPDSGGGDSGPTVEEVN
jgi:molecular chaperone DnaK (HSP70)